VRKRSDQVNVPLLSSAVVSFISPFKPVTSHTCAWVACYGIQVSVKAIDHVVWGCRVKAGYVSNY
jgi:hypothetical protein